MRKWLIGLAAVAGFGGTAEACFCTGPQDDQQKREFARQIALEAVAVAEVERIEGMNLSAMRPELYRVHKVLVGKAPKTFRAYRRFNGGAKLADGGRGIVTTDITDCDAAPASGERKVVVLYDPKRFEVNLKDYSAEERAKIARGDLDMWSACERMFFDLDGGLTLVLEEARKLGKLAR